MTNRSIPTTTLGDSSKQLIGKTPIALVQRGVARTVKLDLTAYSGALRLDSPPQREEVRGLCLMRPSLLPRILSAN